MPDLGLIKQAEQGARDRRGWFSKGRSGNPAGGPRGCGDHVTRAARLLPASDAAALRLILPRFLGSTGRLLRCANKKQDNSGIR